MPDQPRGPYLSGGTWVSVDAAVVCLALVLVSGLPPVMGGEPRSLSLLFLGDNGHHRPADRFRQIEPVLARRQIRLTYTDRLEDLDSAKLAGYDGLVIYANATEISPEQEKALLDFVASGKGFIPIHCASYCFLNSPRYVELVGAQFQRHGTGIFRTTISEPSHPLMKGFGGFESWDETYVHRRHNDRGRTILEFRVDQEGREPWTWIRSHGKGRVFYTAWGHDERTWSQPGFHNLLERGIRWAVGDDPGSVPAWTDPDSFATPRMTELREDLAPFEYIDARIPFYPPSPRWGVIGEPITKMQKPLPPHESIKHFVVPEGFHLELFAAEPDLGGKPIAMNWDERGRLWVAETVDYPNELQPPGKGRDRIRICQDTDGDGRADKFTIFAEQLSIPTSLTFARGGVVVHQAPDTLFLADTDGDDRADVREVLFTGWNTADTHAGPSNLQYGLDNWFWGMQGYAGFDGTVGGERHRFGQGFYRFQLTGPPRDARGKPAAAAARMEFLRSTNNNTWGIGFDEQGLAFGSTANRNPSVYLPIPNRYYERVRGWSASQLGTIADTHLFKPITEKIRQVDHHGGYTAAAGHALYTARAYPAAYWNRTAFVCGPTGHLVGTFLLKRDGSDFRSTSPCNLLASDDEWTAPTMAEVGPDGFVWVIDWYNFIVQHNPTPVGYETGQGNAYVTDLRDKKHGRIYRLVYDGAPESAPTSLAGATPTQLVQTLAAPSLLWRKHAQRMLVERGQRDVLPALLELVRNRETDQIGLNTGAIHALWTLHGLGTLDGTEPDAFRAAVDALGHPSAGVRRSAALVLPAMSASTDALLGSGVLGDADAQVRLAAMLALADMPAHAAAAAAVLDFIQRPENLADRWIPEAAASAAATHDRQFLAALARSTTALARSPTVLADPRFQQLLAVVAEHFARGEPDTIIAGVLAEFAESPLAVVEPVLGGLAKGWPKQKPARLEAKTEQRLLALLERVPPGSQGRLVRLATAWGSQAFQEHAAQIASSLLTMIADDQQAEGARVAAAGQLMDFRSQDAGAVEELVAVLTPRTPPTVADGILVAVGRSQSAAAGTALVARLNELAPAARATALGVLLQRPDSTRSLLDGLEKGQLAWADLVPDQRQMLAAHPDQGIARRARQMLERGGGLPNADRQKVVERFLPLTRQKADADAGLLVFRKQCAKCHVHGSEGTRIGPDLTGMAVHPKEELLIHILDPSRSVEGNFRVYTVVTDEGRILNGLLASETKTTIELFDAEGKKHVVLRDEIERLTASPKSLMPDGFEQQVPQADLANLLEFLTRRGKYLPLPLDKAATIVSTRGMFYSQDAEVERLVFADWTPKTFAGVPFQLIDPRGDRVPNVVMLHGPTGTIPPRMPKSVSIPCNSPAKAIHFLSGVSGWGFPATSEKSVTMIVRLHYADGSDEDHELRNGVHFADYIRRVDVPESQFAFALRGQQIRYFSVEPQRREPIEKIELVKGSDPTAPVVVAMTLESPEEPPRK